MIRALDSTMVATRSQLAAGEDSELDPTPQIDPEGQDEPVTPSPQGQVTPRQGQALPQGMQQALTAFLEKQQEQQAVFLAQLSSALTPERIPGPSSDHSVETDRERGGTANALPWTTTDTATLKDAVVYDRAPWKGEATGWLGLDWIPEKCKNFKPVFTGKQTRFSMGKNSTMQLWQQLRGVARTRLWDSSRMVTCLCEELVDSHIRVVMDSSMLHFTTVTDVLRWLTTHFTMGTEITLNSFRSKFYGAEQRIDQSVQEYLLVLRRYCSEVNALAPSSTRVSEAEFFERWKSGLLPHCRKAIDKQVHLLNLANLKGLNDVSEVLSFLNAQGLSGVQAKRGNFRKEKFRKPVEFRSMTSMSVTDLQASFKKKYGDHRERGSTLNTEMRKKLSEHRLCFICAQEGHLSSECPYRSKKREHNNQSAQRKQKWNKYVRDPDTSNKKTTEDSKDTADFKLRPF